MTEQPKPRPESEGEPAVSELTGPAKAIAVQATKYLRAVYGDSLGYKAPETFPALERWVLALARGDFEWAEQLMTQTVKAINETRRIEREAGQS